MKIAAVIQARMTSTRLPGKVLKEVGGKSLLEFLLERLRHSRQIESVIVATSSDPTDDPIAEFCRKRSIVCHRGPLDNVASRFRGACDRFDLHAFVRVNGDSPLLDPELVDHAIALFEQTGADLVTNVQERTFPPGQSVEVVKVSPFRRAFLRMNAPDHFEHVTTYFYEHPADFQIHNFKSDGAYTDHRLVVDTPEDFKRFTAILQRMTKPHWEYGWKEILPLYKAAAALPPAA